MYHLFLWNNVRFLIINCFDTNKLRTHSQFKKQTNTNNRKKLIIQMINQKYFVVYLK